ncbi:non-ribosomal peptide synthetase, partial [uncultured Chitinophaga sp.]|uniref:non-ribosomal peptide synthetase n=1 Tax=uncultured Chitinophaga sp. TaxID=339340 RepID=UPI002606F4E7
PDGHSLKRVISAGESCPVSLQEKFRTVSFYNKYGPTEATISATIFSTRAGALTGATVPIGKPLRNRQVFILSDSGALQPIGVSGEICIAGSGLARGYLHQPELSAEKFVPNPFRPGERMYRTKDLGRWLPDGNIEFLGRMDEQVKIRGYRIEPAEIEKCLQTFPGIIDAAVAARPNKAGEAELAAYLVATEQLNIGALRDHLTQKLPVYMLPDHYVQLDLLPLNANGKVDKKQLPQPEGISVAGCATYVPPRNDTEQQLINIWQDILGKERIGVKDNFFDLGGHSLKAIQLVSRINSTFSVRLNIQSIFIAQTVENIGEQIMFVIHQSEQQQNRKTLIQIEI